MKKGVLFYMGFGIVAGLLFFGVVYRFQQQKQPAISDSRMQVVASFYPLAHIAEQVGKQYVEVVNLTPAGSEPHDFDPSPKNIASLQSSQVFIYNGIGLEVWAPRVIPELVQKGVRVVDASNGLELVGSDPHVWLDPVLVQEQVKNIAVVFAEADTAHAVQYKENANAYIHELEKLHQEFTSGLAMCKRRDIVTSHAAFAYLAKRYNVNMISIAGLSPDAEPSPLRLAEISRFVRERDITHIFFETLVSPKIAETIATETRAKVLPLNPLEGLSDEETVQGKNYISVQKENLQALRVALDCI